MREAVLKKVLVMISADPTRSERALEGLRMSVGLASGALEVRVLLAGGARTLLDPAEAAFPDWRRGVEYLDAFRRLGGVIGDEADPEAPAFADAVIRWEE